MSKSKLFKLFISANGLNQTFKPLTFRLSVLSVFVFALHHQPVDAYVNKKKKDIEFSIRSSKYERIVMFIIEINCLFYTFDDHMLHSRAHRNVTNGLKNFWIYYLSKSSPMHHLHRCPLISSKIIFVFEFILDMIKKSIFQYLKLFLNILFIEEWIHWKLKFIRFIREYWLNFQWSGNERRISAIIKLSFPSKK